MATVVFSPKYGTSAQAMTITLASLAASATVGRESTAVDNTSTLFDDVLVTVHIETGTVATNKQVLIFAYGTANGGTNYTGGCTGSDAGFTRLDPTVLKPVAVVGTPTSSVVYVMGPFSMKRVFGTMPDHWGLVVCNDTGATLSGTAGNNKAYYQGVQSQGV